MLWTNCILSILLYITIMKYETFAENIHNFENEISNRVKITIINDNVNQVKFNNMSCKIHYHNLTVKPKADESRSKSMQFYFCISCMFADWIQNELFKIIEHVPLLYSSKFIFSYNEEFRKTKSVLTLTNIASNNERFLDVLFNIINMYTYATHIDTDLLKSLMILHFKFNYIKKLNEYDNNIENLENEIIEKDDVIIPLILESINDLQRFSSLNCDISSLYHDNKQFYGYSMNQPGTDGINIDKFFDDIKPLSRESHYQCTVKRILLQHVLDSDDLVSREISNIRLHVKSGRVILKNILTEIRDSYNLDLVLWYLRIVHASIVKIVCTKMLVVLNSRKGFNTNTVRVLNKIGFLFTEYMNLPQKLVDVFRLIMTSMEKNGKSELSVSKYADMKKTILDYLDGRKTPSNDADDDVYDAFRLPFFYVEVITDKSISISLDDLLHVVIDNMVDYRCMANAFAFLNAEKGKYYVPHVQRSFTVYEFLKNRMHRLLQQDPQEPNTLDGYPVLDTWSLWYSKSVDQWWPQRIDRVQIADDPSLVTETCDYLTAVYSYCVDAFVAAAEECWNGRPSRLAQLRGIVSTITESLQLNLFGTGHWSATLSQIAFDVVPMKLIITDHVFQKADTSILLTTELLTYLHMVMTALNGYAVRRCRPPEYNYLLFNNVEFNAASAMRNRDINDRRERFLYEMGERPVGDVAYNDIHLSILKELYVTYEAEFNRQQWFHDGAPVVEPQVRFYWRGEPMTFADIFFNIRTTVMNPTYMYELVDVYYKYVLSTVYRETYAYFNRLITMCNNFSRNNDSYHFRLYSSLEKLDLLPAAAFPKPFNNLVQLFNGIVKMFFSSVVKSSVYLNVFPVECPLAKEFARLGVIVPEVTSEIPAAYGEKKEIHLNEESMEAYAFQEKIWQIIEPLDIINNVFITQFLNQYK